MRYLLKAQECQDGDKGKIINIGGRPTYDPGNAIKENDHFLMEIFNSEMIGAPDDVICWQLYQPKDGGPLTNIITIRKGAELYTGDHVKKRRWLHEYTVSVVDVTDYDMSNVEDDEYEEDEYTYCSTIGGIQYPDYADNCRINDVTFAAIIFESLVKYDDLRFGTGYHIYGFDKSGDLKWV